MKKCFAWYIHCVYIHEQTFILLNLYWSLVKKIGYIFCDLISTYIYLLFASSPIISKDAPGEFHAYFHCFDKT